MRLIKASAAACLLALSLTGCAPANEEAKVKPVDFKACLAVAETFVEAGSIADQALEGLQRAVLQSGVSYKTSVAATDATTPSFVKQLKQLVNGGCDLVISTSHRMAIATYRVAKVNPKVDFILVDATLTNSKGVPTPLENVKELRFADEESAFLAGYLSASKSKSQIVGAVGGANVPKVRSVLAAFKQGVDRYNDQFSKSIAVIGAEGQNAVAWSFTKKWASAALQTKLAYALGAKGADVIYVYTGSALIELQAKPVDTGDAASVLFIGASSDWFALAENSESAGIILASTTKTIAPQVATAITAAVSGEFVGGRLGLYLGDLNNGGVAITQPHSIAYGTSVNAELASLVAQISAGTLVVDSSENTK